VGSHIKALGHILNRLDSMPAVHCLDQENAGKKAEKTILISAAGINHFQPMSINWIRRRKRGKVQRNQKYRYKMNAILRQRQES